MEEDLLFIVIPEVRKLYIKLFAHIFGHAQVYKLYNVIFRYFY